MADVFDSSKRSQIMSHVKSKNTNPEMQLRSLLHRAGYRFRLNRKDLPGTPDIVLPKYKTAIFVNGCFWHGHSCNRGHLPQTNYDFWAKKINGNVERDKQVSHELEELGWHVFIVWECELKKSNQASLLSSISDYLASINGEKNTAIKMKETRCYLWPDDPNQRTIQKC